MLVQPYLSFEGRCDEAVKFYQAAVGAEVLMLMRFKESPDQSMISPGLCRQGDACVHAHRPVDGDGVRRALFGTDGF